MLAVICALQAVLAYDALSSTMAPYPGYTGKIAITGSVAVNVVAGQLQLTYDLAGLEPSTTGGVHIHEGTDCSKAGGHYWKQGGSLTADPWKAKTWNSDESGVGMDSYMIDSGYNDITSNVGHTIVVHLHDGTRAACGAIDALLTLSAEITVLPTYKGDVKISGLFVVSNHDKQLQLGYRLEGLEKSTSGGVHIHAGMNCMEVEQHWYDNGKYTKDPWKASLWSSDDKGFGVGGMSLATGYENLALNIGHAIVVHLADGTKAGCGLLQATPQIVATLGAYPGYKGALHIMGNVELSESEKDALTMQYSLSGLEPSTLGGIHVHAGTSCDHPDSPGGHYWNKNVHDADTWDSKTKTIWKSDPSGKGKGMFEPASGYETLAENVGRVIVAHASDGTRAACGVLKMNHAAPMPTPAMPPTAPPTAPQMPPTPSGPPAMPPMPPTPPMPHGNCGMADLKVWAIEGSKSFLEDLKKCSHHCADRRTCVANCETKRRGYTDDCSACFGDLAHCSRKACFRHCAGSAGPKCQTCLQENCMPTFAECTGLPLKPSGLDWDLDWDVSRLERAYNKAINVE